MNLPKKVKVKLYIYAVKNILFGLDPSEEEYSVVVHETNFIGNESFPNYTLLNTEEIELDVPRKSEKELAEAKVITLRDVLRRQDAEHEVKRNNLLGQIKDLQAIEFQGGDDGL